MTLPAPSPEYTPLRYGVCVTCVTGHWIRGWYTSLSVNTANRRRKRMAASAPRGDLKNLGAGGYKLRESPRCVQLFTY